MPTSVQFGPWTPPRRRRARLRGIRSLFDIRGGQFQRAYSASLEMTIERAIQANWMAVGKDLDKAALAFQQEQRSDSEAPSE